VTLGAATHQFKIAAADWAPEFTNVSQPVVVGAPVTLGAQPGTNTNARLTIAAPGCYAFALNGTNLASPVLTVTGPAAGGSDPDVLADARTMPGERSIVVVVNNQRVAVDLGTLAGGGVPVSGLLADGVVTDLTASGASLAVSGGRLRGVVPALSAVVL
jgi:hypothetical protein